MADVLQFQSSEEKLTRGQKLWEDLKERRGSTPISFERAWLITQAYKETEKQPAFLRRAAAFDKIMRELPIFVTDGQLLCGDFSANLAAAEIFPELTVGWIKDYMEAGNYDRQDEEGFYAFEAGRKEQILEICEYWSVNGAREQFYGFLGEEVVKRLYEENEQGAWIYAASTEAQTEKGWNIPDFSRVIKRGFRGLIADVDAELDRLIITDDQTMKQKNFLTALKQMMESAIAYANRYAKLCRETAKTCDDPARKEELLTMAEACAHVPEHPARTFLEAIQCMWFCHVMIYWDSRTLGLGFGRVDQYLYPYYKKDIEEGRIDKEMATQILECLRVKLCSKRNVYNVTIRAALSNDAHFHNCTIGGQDELGNDAVNELSFLWLDAADRVRSPHPTISVRWHERISRKFMMRALEIVKLGLGFPAFFNDTPSITYMLERGVSLKEARNYAVGGCVLHNPVGCTPTTWPDVMNYAKMFELAMNAGCDPRTGAKYVDGIKPFEEFETYEEFLEAYKSIVLHFLKQTTDYLRNVSIFRGELVPETFVSLFFDDCIKKGRAINQGGAKYQIDTYYMVPVGVVDVSNSLLVLKKHVFGDQTIGKKELLDALKADFEGYDEIYRIASETPNYGNDIEEVDNIVTAHYEWLCDEVQAIPGCYGSHFEVAPHSIAFHANMGLKVGALPCGRKAGITLADGCVSPEQGTDVSGPSAMINSAGRINHERIFGTLFNMKFLPSALAKEEDRAKLAALIRTFFGTYGGKHIQFNVVDKEVLLDAREHPDQHKDLVVRIAGYSALWLELNEDIQNDIIRRTENEAI